METTSKPQKKLALYPETIRTMRDNQMVSKQLLPTRPPFCHQSAAC